MKKTFLVLVLLSVLSVAFAQQTATVIPTIDNTIFSESGAVSNGAGQYLFTGRTNSANVRRTLVSFQVDHALPENAQITSVKLAMKVSKVPSSPVTAIFQLRKVNANWGEGASDGGENEGGGASAETGDATWSHRLFSTQTWGTAGGDFSATVSGSVSIGSTGAVEWATTAQMVADVQAWLANPSANFGWIIIGGESTDKTSKRFFSRSASVQTDRPQLVIQYTTPASVTGEQSLPQQYELQQNYPNPFNPSTTITFSIPSAARTSLKVYDLLGNNVGTLVDGMISAGTHSVPFTAEALTSGIYFYRLQSGSYSAVKKLTLLK